MTNQKLILIIVAIDMSLTKDNANLYNVSGIRGLVIDGFARVLMITRLSLWFTTKGLYD